MSDELAVKPEDMKTAMKLGADLAGTIAKLKANGFQYATAGDTRRLIEEIERLQARLEVDHAFKLVNGKLERFEVRQEDRATFPDGIDCRDETIKLLEEQLADRTRRLTPEPRP